LGNLFIAEDSQKNENVPLEGGWKQTTFGKIIGDDNCLDTSGALGETNRGPTLCTEQWLPAGPGTSKRDILQLSFN
jgi:hypothetical protein